MYKLAAALMQLGVVMCAVPVLLVVLAGTGALLPLFPWGVAVAVLGDVVGVAARPQ